MDALTKKLLNNKQMAGVEDRWVVQMDDGSWLAFYDGWVTVDTLSSAFRFELRNTASVAGDVFVREECGTIAGEYPNFTVRSLNSLLNNGA